VQGSQSRVTRGSAVAYATGEPTVGVLVFQVTERGATILVNALKALP